MYCSDKNDIDAAVVLFLLHVRTGTIASVIEKQTKKKVCKIAGMKGLPSETMKEKETPKQTVRRMMREELGVDWGGEITILPTPLQNLPHRYVVRVAIVEIPDYQKPTIEPQDIKEVAFNAWLTVDEFLELTQTQSTRPETEPALAMFSNVAGDALI